MQLRFRSRFLRRFRSLFTFLKERAQSGLKRFKNRPQLSMCAPASVCSTNTFAGGEGGGGEVRFTRGHARNFSLLLQVLTNLDGKRRTERGRRRKGKRCTVCSVHIAHIGGQTNNPVCANFYTSNRFLPDYKCASEAERGSRVQQRKAEYNKIFPQSIYRSTIKRYWRVLSFFLAK